MSFLERRIHRQRLHASLRALRKLASTKEKLEVALIVWSAFKEMGDEVTDANGQLRTGSIVSDFKMMGRAAKRLAKAYAIASRVAELASAKFLE